MDMAFCVSHSHPHHICLLPLTLPGSHSGVKQYDELRKYTSIRLVRISEVPSDNPTLDLSTRDEHKIPSELSSSTPSMTTIAETIAKLDTARNLVLSDAVYYKDIIPAILPSIGPTAELELRRWGADFLAEAFAAPTFAQDKKQEVAIIALDTLKSLLELPSEDAGTLKSVVQAAASIYPLIFRHT